MKQVRILLWALVAIAVVGGAALFLIPREHAHSPEVHTTTVKASLGGPFTLVGADSKPFSSATLAGKPYAIFFGFTRCGDVCPTTLGRLGEVQDASG